MTTTGIMTHEQAQALLKKFIQARDKEELQQLISDNLGWCDEVFFAELDSAVVAFRAKGDESSAFKLRELGNYMARLRFMI